MPNVRRGAGLQRAADFARAERRVKVSDGQNFKTTRVRDFRHLVAVGVELLNRGGELIGVGDGRLTEARLIVGNDLSGCASGHVWVALIDGAVVRRVATIRRQGQGQNHADILRESRRRGPCAVVLSG